MTLKMRVKVGKEMTDIEISDAGELSFPGYDEMLEYDIAVAAMGGKPTAAMRLLDEWQDNPIETICENFGLDRNTTMSLAADWAEHVLLIFEHAYPKDDSPRKGIEAVRGFVAGKVDAAQLQKAEDAASAAARASAAWAGEAWAASAWAASAAWAAAWGAARSTAGAAAWGAAYSVSLNNDSVEWQQSRNAEVAWQLRHFVHVMERIQAGKTWPPLEATT